MAYRAGAAISDMEFFQFHPTALSLPGAPRFLLSEALRGEGALLLNPAGERFMERYHPRAELAPRDVVARAIVREIAASTTKPPVAYLDMRHLDSGLLRERFPRIYATCKQYGVDITVELVPVRPAAHYLMGGIKTDLEGRSTLAGLYSAGEAACTGVHGANRLASNSLLEGLVFGARVAEVMPDERAGPRSTVTPRNVTSTADGSGSKQLMQQLRDAMWKQAGVIRTRDGLEDLREQIEKWQKSTGPGSTRQGIELRNLLTVGRLITDSALAREESRGAHFREDFPDHDGGRFRKHSIVVGDQISFA
jgi:L-aspartate oxidase